MSTQKTVAKLTVSCVGCPYLMQDGFHCLSNKCVPKSPSIMQHR